jgi:hypothetical protein
MRSIIRRMAATLGAVLLATVPLIGVVGVAPASAVTDELTASYAEPYAMFSTLVRSDQEFRQTFQASVTGQLTRTRILLRSEFANYPVGGIPASVSVYNLNADNTLGAFVDSGSATILGSSWPLPTTDLATFSGGQTLTAGSNYALVVRSQITGWDSSFYAEMTGGTYPYGRGYVCTVGTEDCSSNYWSTWFQVYVSTVVPDTTPPVVNLSVAPDPVLQGLAATATFSATDEESDVTDTTCDPSFAVDTNVAGEHTITCGATSTGGSSEAAYTYTVLSPAEGISDLRADVVADVPTKVAAPLVSLLNSANKALDKGDTTGAIDKLTSFIAQVNAQAGKKIPTDVAVVLVVEAEMLIDSIEASSS